MLRRETILWIILILTVSSTNVLAQGYAYERELVSKIVFKDKKIIDKLLMDLFIPENDVEKIEIFDIDGNGPTEGDLMRVEPSKSVYYINMLTKETREILAGISPDADVNRTSYVKYITSNPKNAEEKILYIISLAISTLYAQDKAIQVYFEQFENGTYKFNLFGYEKTALQNNKDLPLGSGKLHDLLKALYQEFLTEYKDFQPAILRIREVIRDTVYVPVYTKKK